MANNNKIFEYALEFYRLIQERTKVVPMADLAIYGIKDDGSTVNVYEGNLKDVGALMKINSGTTSNVGRVLRGLDCIVELRRAGTRPGLWLVLHPPTENAYNAKRDHTYVTTRQIMPSKYDEIILTQAKIQNKVDELTARVDDLAKRLSEVTDGNNAR